MCFSEAPESTKNSFALLIKFRALFSHWIIVLFHASYFSFWYATASFRPVKPYATRCKNLQQNRVNQCFRVLGIVGVLGVLGIFGIGKVYFLTFVKGHKYDISLITNQNNSHLPQNENWFNQDEKAKNPQIFVAMWQCWMWFLDLTEQWAIHICTSINWDGDSSRNFLDELDLVEHMLYTHFPW